MLFHWKITENLPNKSNNWNTICQLRWEKCKPKTEATTKRKGDSKIKATNTAISGKNRSYTRSGGQRSHGLCPTSYATPRRGEVWREHRVANRSGFTYLLALEDVDKLELFLEGR